MPTSQRRKFKFIGCEIIYREACFLAGVCPHRVDVEFLPKGLHNLETPEMVRRLQAAIDAVDSSDDYEAVLLGYARCNDGLVGVRAGEIPLVIPRAHDCITFFFGSRGAYKRYFDEFPGTYYMTTGWIERDKDEDQISWLKDKGGAAGKLGAMSHEELIAKYGRDNAEFIAQTLGGWRENYSRFCYLKMGLCPEDDYIAQTRCEADERNWQVDLRRGDLTLLEKLFLGKWDEDFVIVRPGRKIVARNDDRILDAE